MLLLLLIITALGYWLFSSSPSSEKKGNEISSASEAVDDLWYKNSIIYNLDVKVFQDTDKDGMGDLKGLTDRLGYIDSLGVTAIWLAPFQPSPLGDDGYDVKDYYSVDERIGTLEDLDTLILRANELDLIIMMDLVINHTSIEHPWYKQARSSKDSPYRDWYIWSQDRPKNQNKGMVFPGVQEEVWTYDSIAGEYYFHRFYKFQPGLNNHNQDVQEEVKKIIKFWLDRGIKGFRLDAVPFILEEAEKEGDEFDHDFKLLHDIREYVKSLDEEAIILGEANVLPEDNEDYLGEDEGLHMMFNFYVNQHIFYALASGEAPPLLEALERTQEKPDEAEWGQFLRNHDEVDLDRLSDEQQAKVFEEFGPEEDMQLYERGIRRRLAPMLGNNRQHLELAYSLLFSLPSSPVMRYGDEIGMGDDLRLKERLAVRTPMQWDNSRNAGFTESDDPIRPVIDHGEYSYTEMNVQGSKEDPASLYNWMLEMISLRKDLPEISLGNWESIDLGSENILALKYEWKDKNLLIIHNLAPHKNKVRLEAGKIDGEQLKDLRNSQILKANNLEFEVSLDEYDYKWLRIE